MEKKFDFNDITLIPTVISNIKSRKDINIYDKNGMLRLMTAPMFDVVCENNKYEYIKNNIYSIIPRKFEYNINTFSIEYNIFMSYGIEDVKYVFIENKEIIDIIIATTNDKFYVLIDVANGHMQYLLDVIKQLKDLYSDRIVIMAGNIANPLTYITYSDLGVDYVRCGIGGGQSCTTSANTSIHYPYGSLLQEVNELKHNRRECGLFTTKVIADGGMHNFSDIIKAYSLGADYVMIGSLFNKTFESSADFYEKNSNGNFTKLNYTKISLSDMDIMMQNGELYKEYKGMSTKEVQKELGRKNLQTSEGIKKYNQVEYSLAQWTENYKDYLQSALSYMGYDNINDMIGNGEYVFITEQAFKRFNK